MSTVFEQMADRQIDMQRAFNVGESAGEQFSRKLIKDSVSVIMQALVVMHGAKKANEILACATFEMSQIYAELAKA